MIVKFACALIIAFITQRQAIADESQAFHFERTIQGCLLQQPGPLIAEQTGLSGLDWSGRCVDGKAHGFGKVSVNLNGRNLYSWDEFRNGEVIDPVYEISDKLVPWKLTPEAHPIDETECLADVKCSRILKFAQNESGVGTASAVQARSKPGGQSTISVVDSCLPGYGCTRHFMTVNRGEEGTEVAMMRALGNLGGS